MGRKWKEMERRRTTWRPTDHDRPVVVWSPWRPTHHDQPVVVCGPWRPTNHNQYMENLSDEFPKSPPRIFVAGMAADSTKEALHLPLAGLENNANVTRSSWNVMVSFHRFSWVPQKKLDELTDLFPWFRVDFVRPNVPIITTEKAHVLWGALYHAPQVKSFSNLEAAGVETAAISALHYDLDGHPSNKTARGAPQETRKKPTRNPQETRKKPTRNPQGPHKKPARIRKGPQKFSKDFEGPARAPQPPRGPVWPPLGPTRAPQGAPPPPRDSHNDLRPPDKSPQGFGEDLRTPARPAMDARSHIHRSAAYGCAAVERSRLGERVEEKRLGMGAL